MLWSVQISWIFYGVLQALLFVLWSFFIFYSHFLVTFARPDQFSGTYFSKYLRITWYKESIRLRASLAEEGWSHDIRNVVFVTKFDNEQKRSNFKIITNPLSTLLRQYNILFYIIFSQMYFCSVQNIMYNLFNFKFL